MNFDITTRAKSWSQGKLHGKATGLPALAWLVLFLLAPLSIVCVYSFLKKGPYGGILLSFTFDNYLRSFDFLYLRIFFASVWLALVTAFSCLVIGFPTAYVMAVSSKNVRNLMLAMIVIPFWTNLVIRAYAVKVFLSEQGLLASLFSTMGISIQSLGLGNSQFAIWFGMVTNYLPFMVMPLYVQLEKFDFTLLEAARDLGARGDQVLFKVMLPLCKQAIMTGFILTFTPALGEFVIPDLFGGAKMMLIGNLITEQFLKSRDWPFGAALSFVLLTVIMAAFFFYPHIEEKPVWREKRRKNGLDGNLQRGV